MRWKRWTISALTVICVALGAVGAAMPARAADVKVITFRGGAEKFVTDISGSTAENGFTNMEPGEMRTLNLTVANADSADMKFYMSAEILDNIAEKGTKNAVYDLTISKNGTEIFAAVIGGENGNNISVGKEYLTEDNNILLDTLSKGESTQIAIALKLDGNSTDNAYMEQSGTIQLAFGVETPTSPAPETVIRRTTSYVQAAATQVVRAAKTGDATTIRGLVILAAVMATLIIAVIVRRKKSKGA